MDIVITMAEYDHIKGALVLCNSLRDNNFNGLFVIGCRNINTLNSEIMKYIGGTDNLVLKKIDPKRHFANYKPNFMKYILDEYEGESITYIDPDIVANCPVDYILSWCQNGPAVCADVNYHMPSNHPSRLKWLNIENISTHQDLDLYFNSGFLSVIRRDKDFLNYGLSL